jgi:CheY-like chemotaxis protein
MTFVDPGISRVRQVPIPGCTPARLLALFTLTEWDTARHKWRGHLGGEDDRCAFDFAELFTIATRQLVRRAGGRNLRFAFDYRGPLAIIAGEAIAMRRSLHRMLLGLTDLVESGVVVLEAQTRLTPFDHCHVEVSAVGSGALASQGMLSTVVSRLQLAQESGFADSAGLRLRRASGDCPITGARIDFEASPIAGVLFRARWRLPAEQPINGTVPHARGALAWIVDAREGAGGLLTRRLQRLGWDTVEFKSCAEVFARLRGMGDANRAPSLLLIVGSRSIPPSSLRGLRDALPATARCFYGVAPGSPALMDRDGFHGFEVWVRPFSPAQLHRLTACVAEPPPCSTTPATPRRPLVLVVDDNEVNRIVAVALVETLGFDAATACDGLEALKQCERLHPAIVLMDLDMPGMDGLTATWRLRELERAGAIAPCSVVAATADTTAEARQACAAAGMDGYLTKPLTMSALDAELHRLCAGCVQ